MRLIPLFLAIAASLGLVGAAQAQTWYVGGSAGAVLQADSDNSGVTGAFATGNGSPAVPNGTAIAAGTPYGWTTEFDTGYALSGEVGMIYDGGFRSGVEIVYTQADVDQHVNVNLGGTNIDGVDVAVLVGSPNLTGTTIREALSEDGGDVSNLAAFLNLYFDFNRAGSLQPYVGAGIGVSQVDVTYQPSGVNVLDTDDTVFAWQLKAGLGYAVNDQWAVYGELAYRETEDLDFNNELFPGTLQVENQQGAVSIGIRYAFN